MLLLARRKLVAITATFVTPAKKTRLHSSTRYSQPLFQRKVYPLAFSFRMASTNAVTTTVIDVRGKPDSIYEKAVSLIQAGELVAFPTETVYGLGANALDSAAAAKIFAAKNRPNDNPLIVHVSDQTMLETLVTHVPEDAKKLMDAFWPGPLTLLLPKQSVVPEAVTCGQPTVAIRMPSHPVAHKLIHLAQRPIAAPSANLSGRPSPTTAQHVFTDLNGRLQCILDGGACDVGLESTVVDVNRSPPLILRPGGVTLEQLRNVLPDIQVYSKLTSGVDLEEKPPTPGLKYRHYSPTATLILYEGDVAKMRSKLEQDAAEHVKNGKKVGLILTNSAPISASLATLHTIRLGDEAHPLEVAQGLFAALRSFDDMGDDLILMEGISEANEGLAVMNRARKAASSVTLCVK